MKVRQHRLFDNQDHEFPYIRSPNQSGAITAEYLVMHYTAGSSAESSINWLTNRDARASAHLVIGRDASVTQLVAFNRKAWHAGTSRWGQVVGLNSCSIGIELDNHGLIEGQAGAWRTAWGRSVPDEQVTVMTHKHEHKERAWHTYTEEQLNVALEVAACLARHYGLRDVLGHDDIAPGRKKDPGPAFPISSFRAAVLGRERDQETYLTTAALNIRTGPATAYDKLAVSPLPKGTRLDVIEEDGVWRHVDVLDEINGEMDISGWVHSRYIAMQYD